MNVLIIDDVLSSCQLLSRHFADLGVDQVEYCRDGRSAVKLLTKYKDHYHIVVVDLHMPQMDGIELLGRLSRIGFKGGVIIASGMESRIIEAASQVVINSRLRLLGALMKPVSASQLKLCIDRLLSMETSLQPKAKPIDIDALRKAIIEHKVVPYYQAQIEIGSGKVMGFEVLCRLQQGEHLQLLTPNTFIEFAEQNNLLNSLTDRLVVKALEEWGDIQRLPECANSSISFNLSPKQLGQANWPGRLMKYCNDIKQDTAKVTIEITENQALDKQAQHTSISRLRMNNFGVAIDDFGTGYTNLSQLCRLPISELKLDMSLVKGIHEDPLSQTILSSLQDISDSLGVNLVAEGVEDIMDFNYLSKIKGLRVQGHLICRPKPFSEIMRWVNAHKKVSPVY